MQILMVEIWKPPTGTTSGLFQTGSTLLNIHCPTEWSWTMFNIFHRILSRSVLLFYWDPAVDKAAICGGKSPDILNLPGIKLTLRVARTVLPSSCWLIWGKSNKYSFKIKISPMLWLLEVYLAFFKHDPANMHWQYTYMIIYVYVWICAYMYM